MIVKVISEKSLEKIIPIRGVINPATKAPTSAVKAVPMTTATARSITLPRNRKARNSLIMGAS